MTAGRVPIRTHAATELEPRGFDLSAHAGEHQSLISCYAGTGDRRKNAGADRAAVVLLPSNHACNQSVLPAAVAKGCIVRARTARDQCAHAVQCVKQMRTPDTLLTTLTSIILSQGSKSRNPHRRPICALEHPVALRLSDAPSISPQLTSHVREQIKGTAIGPRKTCEQLGQRH